MTFVWIAAQISMPDRFYEKNCSHWIFHTLIHNLPDSQSQSSLIVSYMYIEMVGFSLDLQCTKWTHKLCFMKNFTNFLKLHTLIITSVFEWHLIVIKFILLFVFYCSFHDSSKLIPIYYHMVYRCVRGGGGGGGGGDPEHKWYQWLFDKVHNLSNSEQT